MAYSNNSVYCPYCKRMVNTSNAVDFPGVEYNDTPIRYCASCANMFFDSARGEPAVNYYNSPPPAPKNSGWGWFYMLFFAIPGVVYLVNKIWLPGIFLCALAVVILLIKTGRWKSTSTEKRRSELASGEGLTSDVAFSLKRMRNPEYVKLLKELNVQIPEWFINKS